MATIKNLKPFTLYQFKIKALYQDPNLNSAFSQAIECYTNEDSKYFQKSSLRNYIKFEKN